MVMVLDQCLQLGFYKDKAGCHGLVMLLLKKKIKNVLDK
jgi:hypothetical protein